MQCKGGKKSGTSQNEKQSAVAATANQHKSQRVVKAKLNDQSKADTGKRRGRPPGKKAAVKAAVTWKQTVASKSYDSNTADSKKEATQQEEKCGVVTNMNGHANTACTLPIVLDVHV